MRVRRSSAVPERWACRRRRSPGRRPTGSQDAQHDGTCSRPTWRTGHRSPLTEGRAHSQRLARLAAFGVPPNDARCRYWDAPRRPSLDTTHTPTTPLPTPPPPGISGVHFCPPGGGLSSLPHFGWWGERGLSPKAGQTRTRGAARQGGSEAAGGGPPPERGEGRARGRWQGKGFSSGRRDPSRPTSGPS